MKTPPHKILTLLGLFTLALLPLSASAQSTIFFTGSNNALWSVDANWDGGTKPSSIDIAGINGGSGQPSIVDTVFDVGSVEFTGSDDRTISINSGVALVVHGTGTSGFTLLSNAGNKNLTLSGAGDLRLAASGTINVTNGTRAINLVTKVTETGGAQQIVKGGDGLLVLNNFDVAASTYSGGFRLDGGTVQSNVGSSGVANAPTAGIFGTGTLELKSGTFAYTGNSSNGNYYNSVSVTGDVTLGDGGGVSARQNFRFHGDVDLNGAQRELTIALDSTIASRRVIMGVLTNGGLTKAGVGILNLAGVSTYSGDTIITGGTLVLSSAASISSSAEISIASGATLAVENSYALASGQELSGEGTLTGTLRMGDGIVKPGENDLGTLTVAGNGLLDGGEISFGLTSLENAQLAFVGDSFTLTGNTTNAVEITLVDVNATATPGSYLLISTTAMTNPTFTNWGLSAFSLNALPGGWTGDLRFEDDNLYFDLVPEPGSAALLLLGASFLAIRRRNLRPASRS